jgi:hypothetical protein
VKEKQEFRQTLRLFLILLTAALEFETITIENRKKIPYWILGERKARIP